MKQTIVSVFVIYLAGCTTVGSVDRPENYSAPADRSHNGLLIQGQPGDIEKTINWLLSHRLTLPAKNRIAIVKLGRTSSWRYYSSEFNTITDEIVRELVVTLRNNKRVYDASFLPGMLIPEHYSVPVLRESAARYQADLLLAYNDVCRSYEKFRLIKSDISRSYCVVEAVLLDIRSGVVAKSVVSLEEFESEKTSDDLSLREATRKAELSAIAKALGNIAREIDDFLKVVPTS